MGFDEKTSTQNVNWLGNARKYEWKDEYGEVGERIPELEEDLFNSMAMVREGQHRQVLDIEVRVEGPERLQPIRKFEDAGIHPVILENISLCKYTIPMPIQSYVIPAALAGHDIVGISQTGSGKTAAYLVPALSKLAGKIELMSFMRRKETGSRLAEPLILVVVPTRELAIQIHDDARRLCYRTMMRPCLAIGEVPLSLNFEELAKGCDILVGTPGRLVNLMNRPDALSMSRVKYTIIDEADRMLDSENEEKLSTLMAGGDTNEDADHAYMMFSATFAREARSLARKYMAQDHYRIQVGRPGQSHKNIRQVIKEVDHFQRAQEVLELLEADKSAKTLIFCNGQDSVDTLDAFLYNKGLPVTSSHGGRSQSEREDAFTAFRTGRCEILIVTGGLGARGWDVAGVTHVINYDLPTVGKGGIDEYVHRIGRTARMGNTGLATSLYTSHDEGLAQDLVNHLVENECEVPEFLSHLTPQEAPDFGDESEDEDAAENSGDPHSGDGAAENGGEHHDSHQGGEDEVNKVAGKLAMVDFKPEGFTPEPSATAASAW